MSGVFKVPVILDVIPFDKYVCRRPTYRLASSKFPGCIFWEHLRVVSVLASNVFSIQLVLRLSLIATNCSLFKHFSGSFIVVHRWRAKWESIISSVVSLPMLYSSECCRNVVLSTATTATSSSAMMELEATRSVNFDYQQMPWTAFCAQLNTIMLSHRFVLSILARIGEFRYGCKVEWLAIGGRIRNYECTIIIYLQCQIERSEMMHVKSRAHLK